MDEIVNPDYPNQRGCFIDKRSAANNGTVKVVDYPTWKAADGVFVFGGKSEPIPDGNPSSWEFADVNAAKIWAAAQHYVVCAMPSKLDPKHTDANAISEAYDAAHADV